MLNPSVTNAPISAVTIPSTPTPLSKLPRPWPPASMTAASSSAAPASASNKVKGAYAAVVNNVYQAQRAQLSNNANIITIGAQVTGIEVAKMMVKEYLSCTFDPNSRSAPKIERIYEYEKANS